jgi:hypothetical protein
VTEADITATCGHGILNIRVLMPNETAPELTKIAVETA